MKRWAVAGVGLVVAGGLFAPQAGAAMAVIDVRAIVQLKQQVSALRDQLAEARATVRAMTGSRGMQNLLNLSDAARNYLPRDWGALEGLRDSGVVRGLAAAQAVLSAAQLAGLTADDRALVEGQRQSRALLQQMTREALARTSDRFASLRTLQAAIGSATDAKAIADLSGRIEIENAMLANEQAKLDTLYQLAASEQRALEWRTRERTVAAHGSFGTRFTPVAP